MSQYDLRAAQNAVHWHVLSLLPQYSYIPKCHGLSFAHQGGPEDDESEMSAEDVTIFYQMRDFHESRYEPLFTNETPHEVIDAVNLSLQEVAQRN